jgi:predicted metal-dependent hydrolase
VPVRGAPHRIVHWSTIRGLTRATTDPKGEPILAVSGEVSAVTRRVTDFLKREALKDLNAAVDRHTAALGIPARKVTVRDTASRWGSCSSKGHLSFSWRLIMAPPLVLDYLAAHEVAHLKEMNHSHRFWALTHRLCPKTEEAEAWLKRNGASLHRYG